MRASPIAGRPGAPDEAEATNDLTDRPSIVLVNGLWPVWVDVVGYDPRWPDLYQRAAVQTPRRSSSVRGALGRLETLALPLRAASIHRWFGRRGCTPDGSRLQAIHLARRSDDTRSAACSGDGDGRRSVALFDARPDERDADSGVAGFVRRDGLGRAFCAAPVPATGKPCGGSDSGVRPAIRLTSRLQMRSPRRRCLTDRTAHQVHSVGRPTISVRPSDAPNSSGAEVLGPK